MRVLRTVIILFLSMALSQCASYDFSRRITQQGNLLPQEKIMRLRVGMSKEDVAILMGTSLLSPTFNNNRWDYAYTFRRGNGTLRLRNATLYFSHGVLERIEHHP